MLITVTRMRAIQRAGGSAWRTTICRASGEMSEWSHWKNTPRATEAGTGDSDCSSWSSYPGAEPPHGRPAAGPAAGKCDLWGDVARDHRRCPADSARLERLMAARNSSQKHMRQARCVLPRAWVCYPARSSGDEEEVGGGEGGGAGQGGDELGGRGCVAATGVVQQLPVALIVGKALCRHGEGAGGEVADQAARQRLRRRAGAREPEREAGIAER